MKIDFDRFLSSFQYMGKGMLGIFIVIGALILTVYGLNKLMNSPIFNKPKDED